MILDVIGGNADGTQIEGSFVVSREIMGDKYIALEFLPDPNIKNTTVTIYMLAGTIPRDAMRIWRERNMKQTEEQWERLCDTARSLINAPASVVAEDPENFLAMIDISLAAIEAAKMRVGRGGLILELGDKRKDIREHPERYKNLSGGVEGRHAGSMDEHHGDKLPGVVRATHSVNESTMNSGSSAPPAQNLQDAEVGGALCPECSGLHVHNDNCSQKNLPVPVLADAETRSCKLGDTTGEARESTNVKVPGNIGPETSRGGQNLSDDSDDEEDKDDAPW